MKLQISIWDVRSFIFGQLSIPTNYCESRPYTGKWFYLTYPSFLYWIWFFKIYTSGRVHLSFSMFWRKTAFFEVNLKNTLNGKERCFTAWIQYVIQCSNRYSWKSFCVVWSGTFGSYRGNPASGGLTTATWSPTKATHPIKETIPMTNIPIHKPTQN